MFTTTWLVSQAFLNCLVVRGVPIVFLCHGVPLPARPINQRPISPTFQRHQMLYFILLLFTAAYNRMDNSSDVVLACDCWICQQPRCHQNLHHFHRPRLQFLSFSPEGLDRGVQSIFWISSYPLYRGTLCLSFSLQLVLHC